MKHCDGLQLHDAESWDEETNNMQWGDVGSGKDEYLGNRVGAQSINKWKRVIAPVLHVLKKIKLKKRNKSDVRNV